MKTILFSITLLLLLATDYGFAQTGGLPNTPPPKKSMKIETVSISFQNGQLYIQFNTAINGVIAITSDNGYAHCQSFVCTSGETIYLKAPACGCLIRIEDTDGTLIKEIYLEL